MHFQADGKLVVEKVPLDCNEVLAYPCDILSPCALGNVSGQIFSNETFSFITSHEFYIFNLLYCNGQAFSMINFTDHSVLIKDKNVGSLIRQKA